MKTLIQFLLALIILCSTSSIFSQDEPLKKDLKPALIIIDVQNAYMQYMSQEDQKTALDYMNWAIWLFRKYDLPIIRVYHTDDQSGPFPGSHEFEFVDTLQILESDPQIIKKYPSAFTKTDFDKLLKENDINTLFICGLSSVGCALATYFDCYAHEYKAFLIKDALLCHNAEYTNSIEIIFNAIDFQNLMFMVELAE
ncbi:cysteine hydrolase family protein [Bacteroidota bacterium]